MPVQAFLDAFSKHHVNPCVYSDGRRYEYADLAVAVERWQRALEQAGIRGGQVVALACDFSFEATAAFFALARAEAIVVPISSASGPKRPEFLEVAEVEIVVGIQGDAPVFDRTGRAAHHDLYQILRSRHHPGLVLFSSGSTGKSKGAVHDLLSVLKKFQTPRPALRTAAFLLFDHIGGINTVLHTLANGGYLVALTDRTPDAVLQNIAHHEIELLPTSPTFLNLMLLSEAHKRHDLSSLKLVTYGTEPMMESTLKRLNQVLPAVEFRQTYGLSELGIMRTKSKSSDSLLVKIGGEGFQTRIVDGVLHIKAESAILGYLNAPSPFTEDGWFNTGDAVQVIGDYIRILGRGSEIINVGGEKVYPSEVESVIQEVPEVAEVTVFGENNPITGQIVCARVRAREDADRAILTQTIKRHCRTKLQAYKVPVKLTFDDRVQFNARVKKTRVLGDPA